MSSRRDRKAIAAAIAEPWSNGQTEGQITKLRLVKRQMCGRAKLDLIARKTPGCAQDSWAQHEHHPKRAPKMSQSPFWTPIGAPNPTPTWDYFLP
jgi:hypothetical protein